MEARERKWDRRVVLAAALVLVLVISIILGLAVFACAPARAPAPPELLEKGEEGAAAPQMEALLLEEDASREAVEVGEAVPAEELAVSEAYLPAGKRKVIRNAQTSLEVEEGKFSETFDRIVLLAESVGGWVSSSDSQAWEGELASGTVVIRVPAKNFTSVLTQIKAMGKILSINIQGSDVTPEYVDLESRLRNLKAQERILLELMGKAETIGDTIAVQTQLSYVQQEIEIIKGRMQYLDDLVAFSTIQAYLTEPEVKEREPIEWGFGDAFYSALKMFVEVIQGVIVLGLTQLE
ncbi:hypothetical protein HKBW3S09_01034 [Candidatus Hakubella thermalkaliphila]|uniref:DUF4349 domain-containing protein n=1 Tax=Candidatus Hakubella thermalkaliphila TaxID=2754717 RepID=A0A6V8NTB7_9ACTN|nr:DUF4349 domain-containing protein [Candidatus Hakubella thermalkaliphila]GFP23569.1 hypothetical protein HKBW3S09_01034 [Candidatus Hakubella thermalkaliphila]GFP30209.1 hypothetical protein HKBW3S34_01129 [Candidatus Hakubella thermalkaliphila]GFP39354.1 hypothetical protein HKBW3S47_01053 [Candidatus Hakubella thermalkaliphila]